MIETKSIYCLCTECRNLFDCQFIDICGGEIYTCPVFDCEGWFIEIDGRLVDAVNALNECGYELINIYFGTHKKASLFFKGEYNFETLPEGFSFCHHYMATNKPIYETELYYYLDEEFLDMGFTDDDLIRIAKSINKWIVTDILQKKVTSILSDISSMF